MGEDLRDLLAEHLPSPYPVGWRPLGHERAPSRGRDEPWGDEMRRMSWLLAWGIWVGFLLPVSAEEAKSGAAAALEAYFPPSESRGGWRSLLPERGEPSAEQKSQIRAVAGVDWDKLAAAWEHNAAAPGATGLLVIRKGQVVGE